MRQLRWIIILLVVLLVVILAVQNYESLATPVKFRANFIFFNYESSGMPLSFVAVVTFLIGVVAAGFYGMVERFRLKREIRGLTREIREKEKELNSLRNLPVTTDDVGTGPPPPSTEA